MAVDTDFNSVSLLLHCNDADASTTFTDNSLYGHTVTANGNAQVDTAQSKFGGASALFDGTGDYLSLSSNAAFGFGTGDFTIEAWIRPNVVAGADRGIIDMRSAIAVGNGTFFIDNTTSNKLAFYDGSTKHGGTGTTITTGTWHHVALSRSGSTLRCFLNGTLDFSATMSTDLGASRPVGIGGGVGTGLLGDSPFNGWIDDVRITKGVARYTANFSVPTIEYPNTNSDSDYSSVTLHLPCNGTNTSTSILDTKGHTITVSGNAQISTAQSKWNGSSVLFDGTGDFLNAGFVAMGPSNFTLEGWFYFNALGAGNRTLFSQYTGADAARTILDIRNAKLSIFSGANGVQSGSTTLSTGQWYHIAFVRVGTTCKGYINGTLEVTHSTFQTPYSTNTLIGSYTGASGDEYSGYMDDIRFTNGVARYTTDFTAPTGPYPTTGVDSNFNSVILLLHGEGTDAITYFEDQAPTTNTLAANGNAQTDTAQFKWGSSSTLFDGTGDWLSYTSSTGIGTGDMTIEAWIRINSLTNDGEIFCIGDISNTSAFNIVFEVKSTGAIRFSVQDGAGGSNVDISSAISQVTTATWYHVAATVSGTAANIWLNGTSIASGTLTGSRSGSRTDFRIGRLSTAVTRDFNGWIDDIRVTKGVARYTGAFTPALGAFPDTGVTTSNFILSRVSKGIDDIYNYVLPINFLYF